MNPLVYQVVIGEVKSETLKKCIDSVYQYAIRMGYDYTCDTEKPVWAKDMLPGTASEWMRIHKIISRPKVMYVDWDLEIFGDFELKDDIVTVPTSDTLIYYGKHIDIAKKVFEEMGSKEVYTQDEYDNGSYGMGHRAFSKIYGDYSKHLLDKSKYRHLKYHITKYRYK